MCKMVPLIFVSSKGVQRVSKFGKSAERALKTNSANQKIRISGRPNLKFRQQFRPKLPVSAKFRFRPKPKKVSAETQDRLFIIAALF